MIYIKNQITAIFSIADIQDFIDPTNFEYLALYEQAGNRIPLLKLTFIVNNRKLLDYLNDGNILNVSFGINEPSTIPTQFQIVGDTNNIDISIGSRVNLTAKFYLPSFTDYFTCNNYYDYSYNVINFIGNKHKLNYVSNVSKTNDLQNWYQNGLTDWQFLQEVWLASYLNNETFFSLALDSNNIYFYNVRDQISKGPKWLFSVSSLGSNNSSIINFGQYRTTNSHEINNYMAGKNIVNATYNVDTGEFSSSNYKLKNFTLLDSDKINMNTTNCRQYSYDITTNDLHNNYITAKNQNIRNNILFDSFTIYIPTAGQFKKLRLLDLVEISSDVNDRRVQGLSFVTGITYEWTGSALSTNIILNKEAPNGIKGNLQVGE